MAWDEGTARDHMQLCTKPARKWEHSRCFVGSFGSPLGHPKAQPQGLLPTGVGGSWVLQCGPCSWSPKLLLAPPEMLLGGCSGSWVPKWGLDELMGPTSSSVQEKWPPLEQHPQGTELPPVATLLGDMPVLHRLEQQLCLVLWLGNSREFSGSHRMAQGATATTSGDIVQHSLAHPITSGRIHRSIALSPSSLGKAEDSFQGQVESFQGWDFGDTHPTELSCRCLRHGLNILASPGEPEGTHKHPIALLQEGWDSQNRSRDPGTGKAPTSPQVGQKKKLSDGWGPVAAHAGSDRQLQQHMKG